MNNSEQKKIEKPRRILILGSPDSGILEVLKKLTGSAPEPVDGSIAGLLHTWSNMTKYYTAEVPIWIDEVSDIKAWASEFKNEEAKEVVLSIGAFIYCFRRPKNEEDLESARQAFYAINEVVDKWFDLSFDGSKLAISTPAGANASLLDLEKTDWEGFCDENEFEFIDCSVDKARELGQTFSYERLREALEVTDWDASVYAGDVEGEDLDNQSLDFMNQNFADIMKEFGDMKQGLNQGFDDEDDEHDESVESLGAMMVEAQAIRDLGADMPEHQRKQFIEKQIRELVERFNL